MIYVGIDISSDKGDIAIRNQSGKKLDGVKCGI